MSEKIIVYSNMYASKIQEILDENEVDNICVTEIKDMISAISTIGSSNPGIIIALEGKDIDKKEFRAIAGVINVLREGNVFSVVLFLESVELINIFEEEMDSGEDIFKVSYKKDITLGFIKNNFIGPLLLDASLDSNTDYSEVTDSVNRLQRIKGNESSSDTKEEELWRYLKEDLIMSKGNNDFKSSQVRIEDLSEGEKKSYNTFIETNNVISKFKTILKNLDIKISTLDKLMRDVEETTSIFKSKHSDENVRKEMNEFNLKVSREVDRLIHKDFDEDEMENLISNIRQKTKDTATIELKNTMSMVLGECLDLRSKVTSKRDKIKNNCRHILDKLKEPIFNKKILVTGKDSIGKTFIASVLAKKISKEEVATIVIDLDVYSPKLYKYVDDTWTYVDLVEGSFNNSEGTIKYIGYEKYSDLLSSGFKDYNEAMNYLIMNFDSILSRFENLIIIQSYRDIFLDRRILDQMNDVIIVSDCKIDNLKTSGLMFKEIKEKVITKTSVIVNRWPRQELDKKDIAVVMGILYRDISGLVYQYDLDYFDLPFINKKAIDLPDLDSDIGEI